MNEETPQLNTGRVFAEWITTFISFPVGGIAALSVVGPMDGVSSAAFGGAIAGLVVGLAQWVILRRHVGMNVGWVFSTVAGLALGNTVGFLLNGGGTGAGDLAILGATAGIAVGLAQWASIQEYMRQAILWPIAVALAWPLAWTVTWLGRTNIDLGYATFDPIGALAFAAVTGLALLVMARSTNAATLRRVENSAGKRDVT